MNRTLRPVGAASATQTDEQVSVVSLSPPKRRRPSWVLLGVLLVGLAALVGAYVFVDRVGHVVGVGRGTGS